MTEPVVPTEPVVTEPVKNDASVTTNINDNSDELERLRKEKTQAEMRANQLANELAAQRKIEEDAKQKQLEEQNEYKTLYEREAERRRELETERENEMKAASIGVAQSTLLSGYSSEVKDIAATAGLTLTDDSEEAKEAFKAKLDVLKEKIGGQEAKVVGNNGVIPPAPKEGDRAEQLAAMRISPEAKKSVIGNLSVLNQMRRNAGLQVDE